MIREYKFGIAEAVGHIESVNGKKLKYLNTGTAYYTGQPRVYWQFEGEKDNCDNPDPHLGGGGIDSLFFPGSEVVSRNVDIYAQTFGFVVREKEDEKPRPSPGHGMLSLRSLLDACEAGMLLRITEEGGGEKVVYRSELTSGTGSPDMKAAVRLMLDRKVLCIRGGTSLDPRSTHVPTIWIQLDTLGSSKE